MKYLILPLFFLFYFCSYSQQHENISDDNKDLTLQDKIYTAIDKVYPSYMEIHNNDNSSLGSGFYVGEGYIITNRHVVALNEFDVGKNIQAINPNSKNRYDVEVVYADNDIDYSILKIKNYKIEEIKIPVASLGNSDNIKLGEFVICIGSPLGYSSSVTNGHISGLFRYLKGDNYDSTNAKKVYIQIDATINRGNSGGPLVNVDGEVIGINTAAAFDVFQDSKGDYPVKAGLNFSIPINLIKPNLKNLKNNQSVIIPYIGFSMNLESFNADLGPEYIEKIGLSPGSIQLKEIDKDSPLDKSGVLVDDIITEIDGKKLQGIAHFIYKINSCNWKDILKLKIYRPSSYSSLVREVDVPIGRVFTDELKNKILTKFPYNRYIDNRNVVKIGTDPRIMNININDEEDYIQKIKGLYMNVDLPNIWIQYQSQTPVPIR